MPTHDGSPADVAPVDDLISDPGGTGPEVDLRVPGAERQAQSATPAPMADVRRAYLGGAALGYVIYLVGAVTAFLAVALSLSDAQAGLRWPSASYWRVSVMTDSTDWSVIGLPTSGRWGCFSWPAS